MTYGNIPGFDVKAAIKALRDDQDLTGKNGILTPLVEQVTKAVMQGQLEQHLAKRETPNRKNHSRAV